MGALLVFQRVDIGHEMPTHPERVNELLHPGGLADLVAQIHMDVAGPVDGLVGDSQVGEDPLVEVTLADK